MAFAEEVPAQREAVRFLDQAAVLGIPLRVGGHSKGGNLAVYAAARCSGAAQARICLLYTSFRAPTARLARSSAAS